VPVRSAGVVPVLSPGAGVVQLRKFPALRCASASFGFLALKLLLCAVVVAMYDVVAWVREANLGCGRARRLWQQLLTRNGTGLNHERCFTPLSTPPPPPPPVHAPPTPSQTADDGKEFDTEAPGAGDCPFVFLVCRVGGGSKRRIVEGGERVGAGGRVWVEGGE
jgi:hypothetical protein